tara:strand:- start:486 stop:842 length:357 start_codon:yes stop_codon:yes gene_type:complete
MIGLLRGYIENFDLQRFPHEYPAHHRTYWSNREVETRPEYRTHDYADQNRHAWDHGHIKKYMDFHRGYTTIYDIGVYIIVAVFMGVLIREVFLVFNDERNKAYMVVCLIVLGICAVLY